MRSPALALLALATPLAAAPSSDLELVKEINLQPAGPDSLNPGDIGELDGTLFFRGHADGLGDELFYWDGSTGGLFADLFLGPNDGAPQDFTRVGDLLFFTARSKSSGRELWVTDGTVGGTQQLGNIAPDVQDPNITEMTAVGNLLFFSAGNGPTGKELWRSDGTLAGTFMVVELTPGFELPRFETPRFVPPSFELPRIELPRWVLEPSED